MYTIYLDSTKVFECTLKLKGINIKNTKVNLVIETDNFDLRCKGNISHTGKVSIPIKKLKGILNENTKGKLYLEVIADDNYFIPFNSSYITEIHKKVDIIENIQLKDTEYPVQLVESIITGLNDNVIKTHARKIIKNMANKKINIFKLEHKNQVVQYIQNYIVKNKIKESSFNILLKEIIINLIK